MAQQTSATVVERRLQISIALMVGFGAVLLGIAQQSLLIAVLGFPAALAAPFLADFRRWIVLNRLVANLLALTAAIVVLLDFIVQLNNRDQLASISNLLLSLQFVLLYQVKTPRTYGYLAILSLLQVAVSASFSVEVEFGLLLLPYMAAAVYFLAHLFACSVVWPRRHVTPIGSYTLLILLTALYAAIAILLQFDWRWLAELMQVEVVLDRNVRFFLALVLPGALLTVLFVVQAVQIARRRDENRRFFLGALLLITVMQFASTVVLRNYSFPLAAVSLAALPLALLILRPSLRRHFATPGNETAADGPNGQVVPPQTAHSPAGRFGAPPRLTAPADAAILARDLSRWTLRRHVAAYCAATLLFAVVLFASLPRSEDIQQYAVEGDWVVAAPEGEVKLNEMADIVAQDSLVFTIEFVDEQTQKPYKVFSDLYVRGTVLESYEIDGRDGARVWRPGRNQDGSSQSGVADLRVANSGNLVRQKLSLQPVRSARDALYRPSLYAVYPAFRPEDSETDFYFTTGSKRILIPDGRQIASSYSPQARRFELCTTAFARGIQSSIYPHESGSMIGFQSRFRSSAPREPALLQQEIALLTTFERSKFPHVARIADEVAALEPDASRAHICRALQAYFRDSDQFTYTLEFSEVERRAGVDPIEDFVANHRSGHCEYFASALVIALRSQGIPARMVIGYRGGTYNSIGGFYEFRQNNAHAWVEAYLEPGDETERLMPPGKSARFAGAWMRLDPTPLGGDELSDGSSMLATISELYSYTRLIWHDYVVNLNSRQQQEAIFGPIASVTRSAERLLGSGSDRQGQQQEAGSQEDEESGPWHWGWFAAGGIFLACAGWGLIYVLRKLRRAKSALRQGGRLRSATAAPFYERLTRLLRRQGLVRPATQTQREFAGLVGGEFNESPLLRETAGVPRQIVEAYYRVRFGREQLAVQELAELDWSLDRLEAALVVHRKQSRQPRPRETRDGEGRAKHTAS